MKLARRVFSLLYLVGTAAALSFEVVWTRLLTTTLGSSIEASACVLAAFMGGLGLGAWCAAAWVERLQRPLRAFGWLQALGALLAWLPYLVALLPPPGVFWLGLISVGLAATPLGWSFPLAVRIREDDRTGHGGRAGHLYALDTAGALLGCVATGVFLIPSLGLRLTLVLASGLKLLAAFVVSALPEGNPDTRPDPHLVPRGISRNLLLLVALQGMVLLGAETLWNRLLALTLFRGSTTYALVAMLASVLAFTSLGAFAVGRDREPARNAWIRACWCSVFCGMSLLASLVVFHLAGPVRPVGVLAWPDLLITVLATGPASFFSGAVFALACRVQSNVGSARGAASVLAANTLGAVGGALIVPLLLIPAIGLGGALLLLSALTLTAASLLLWTDRQTSRAGLVIPAAALVIAFLLALEGPRWTRHLGPTVFYREGRDVSVAVVEDPPGVRRLFVDGIAVAGTDLAMLTDQKTLAHLPVLLHPDPRAVLTVGFGSGGTSKSLLLHPKLQVDCVEISDSVPQAAGFLKDANGGLLDHPEPRFQLHLRDAREFLAVSAKRWDVIVNDCTDLAYRSDASLYTEDFFRQVRSHLNPNGIGAVWIPLRGQRPYRVLRSVIGSFASVFPSVSLWVSDAYPVHFGILVGTERELEVDLARLQRGFLEPAVSSDLAEIGLADPWRLVTSRQFDDRALRDFASGTTLHTDDRPVVEFWAPFEAGDDSSAYQALFAIGYPSPPAKAIHVAEADLRILAKRWQARPWLLGGHLAFLEGCEDCARVFYLRALRADPTGPAARNLLGIPAAVVRKLAERAVREPMDLSSVSQLGAIRLMEGGLDEADVLLDRAHRIRPLDRGTLLALGFSALYQGRAEEAAELFRETMVGQPPEKLARTAWLGWELSRLPALLRELVLSLTFAGL